MSTLATLSLVALSLFLSFLSSSVDGRLCDGPPRESGQLFGIDCKYTPPGPNPRELHSFFPIDKWYPYAYADLSQALSLKDAEDNYGQRLPNSPFWNTLTSDPTAKSYVGFFHELTYSEELDDESYSVPLVAQVFMINSTYDMVHQSDGSYKVVDTPDPHCFMYISQ